ncbi:hypothetical protein Ga0609869_002402 [Rhodovulum iodosum]|uniref:Polysaccharide pyruvyl transferase domain-containing protein n=1 Tax=Rhodovulum iodosum TaxID=68291 RepID=A0ABV3XVE3_9RHOB|nr:polysaccharide pyruvyl transferase family protein [Rhodovulum robiginosum]RSK35093.1 polysaccharide pyruvyl transferase family protein [Rhodovulum robiginosum]
MKAVILNFTGGRENWGCQATSWGLHAFLARRLAPVGLRELSVVPFLPRHRIDRAIERRHGARIAAIQGDPAPAADDLRFLEGLAARRFGPLLDRVRGADLVVFQGEGTMGAPALYRRVAFFTLPVLARHLYGKPVFSLNQSFVTESAADAARARAIFGGFDMVALREFRSYSLVRGLGLEGALLCPDMAFVAPQDATRPPAGLPSGGYFCVTGSAALAGYDVAAYLDGLKRIADAHGLMPVFLYSRPLDRALYDSAVAAWGPAACRAISSRDAPDFRALLPVLKGAALVVGGRYHSSVSALSQGTPVIPTAGNSHKAEGLSALMGCDIPVLEHDRPEALAARADAILAAPGAARAEVAEGMARVRARIDAFGEHLAAAASARLSGRAAPPPPAMLRPAPELLQSTPTNAALYRGRAGAGLVRRWHRDDAVRAGEDLRRKLSLAHNLAVYDVPTRRL